MATSDTSDRFAAPLKARQQLRAVYLVELRKEASLTQEQLAARSGVDQTTISKLERLTQRGRRGPTFSVVLALAKALDVQPEQLRFGPNRRRAAGVRAAKTRAIFAGEQ